jgi:hypothetical protein
MEVVEYKIIYLQHHMFEGTVWHEVYISSKFSFAIARYKEQLRL